MIHFKHIVIVFTFFLSINSAFAQLPEDWLGQYKGVLHITNYKSEVSEVEMEILIEAKTDTSYSFIITYVNDTSDQVRSYELIHDKGNQYVMDEKNGIILPLMLFNNRLVSVFNVENNMIQVSYTLEKKTLVFRTNSSQKSIPSGGRNGTPKVQGYLPYVDQYGSLKKLK